MAAAAVSISEETVKAHMKNIPANDRIPSRHDRPQTRDHRHLSASESVDRLTESAVCSGRSRGPIRSIHDSHTLRIRRASLVEWCLTQVRKESGGSGLQSR
jgi:hypothetical protein